MKEKKMTVYDDACELCNEVADICLNEAKALSDAEKELGNKYDPTNFFLEAYNCDTWFENQKSAHTTKDGEEEFAYTRKGNEEEPADLSSMAWRKSKRRKTMKNLHLKQTINYTSNNMSTKKLEIIHKN